jgi:hypothetical protein
MKPQFIFHVLSVVMSLYGDVSAVEFKETHINAFDAILKDLKTVKIGSD